jgi:hypothetical protein
VSLLCSISKALFGALFAKLNLMGSIAAALIMAAISSVKLNARNISGTFEEEREEETGDLREILLMDELSEFLFPLSSSYLPLTFYEL